MLMIIHPYGDLYFQRVIQGSREGEEKSDLSEVAEVWHHDLNLWRVALHHKITPRLKEQKEAKKGNFISYLTYIEFQKW